MTESNEPTFSLSLDNVDCELNGLSLRLGPTQVSLTAADARALAGRLIEAAASSEGLEDAVEKWQRIPMQYLRFEVEAPLSDDPKDPEVEVALAHCWIKDQSETNAQHVATGWIIADGWDPQELIEHRPVSRKDFEGTEQLVYYEQALIDDEVFLMEIEEEND